MIVSLDDTIKEVGKHGQLTKSFVGIDRANSSRWIQDLHIFSIEPLLMPQSMKTSLRKVNAWLSIS